MPAYTQWKPNTAVGDDKAFFRERDRPWLEQFDRMFHYWWGRTQCTSAVVEDGASWPDSAFYYLKLRLFSYISTIYRSRGWCTEQNGWGLMKRYLNKLLTFLILFYVYSTWVAVTITQQISWENLAFNFPPDLVCLGVSIFWCINKCINMQLHFEHACACSHACAHTHISSCSSIIYLSFTGPRGLMKSQMLIWHMHKLSHIPFSSQTGPTCYLFGLIRIVFLREPWENKHTDNNMHKFRLLW